MLPTNWSPWRNCRPSPDGDRANIGLGYKFGKEQIVGLIAALRTFHRRTGTG
jgi:hypothetical protein